jgi:2-polyprenyl-3-methyl-5-hydroxy-6-metoxy-1,4-benzoquinol methylase
MIRAVGHADPQRFERLGKSCWELISASLERHGQVAGDLRSVLDFGCGCGRVLRHWASLDGPSVHGTDYDRRAVEWCAQELPFAGVSTNELAPPLRYADGQFELVYALSVFTHLTEELAHAWMAELRRVVSPVGLLYFTTLGERHAAQQLTPKAYAAFRAGRFVATDPRSAGSNLRGAFTSKDWVVGRLLDGWELLEHLEGQEEMMGGQDAYLVRRSA